MGMNLGPDVDDIVRVQFQLYLLQGFLEWVGVFSTIPEVTENIIQRHSGISAVLYRPVDGLPQPTKGSLCQWLFESQARAKT